MLVQLQDRAADSSSPPGQPGSPIQSSPIQTGSPIQICELEDFVGQTVVIHGWVTAARSAGSTRFLQLRDRSGEVQIVDRRRAVDTLVHRIELESAIRVAGDVRTPRSTTFGAVEIAAQTIDLIAPASRQAQGRKTAFDPLRHRFLAMRHRSQALTFEVRTAVVSVIRDHLLARKFLEVQTPKITASGSESGAALFELDYFGDRAYLVQSPQFYMQMAMAAGLDRVFEIGPSFRAEPGVTARHATEFTSIDVEWSWVSSHEDAMNFEEDLLRHVLTVVSENFGSDIRTHFNVDIRVPENPFVRLAYDEALEIAGSAKLTNANEQSISKYAKEQSGSSFAFIEKFPTDDRPFYTRWLADGRTASFDLLWRGVEISSGCVREHNCDALRSQMEVAGLSRESMNRYLEPYYLEMFQFGCPPHGGFGIGLDRFLMLMLGASALEEVSFAHRSSERFMP